MTVLQSQILSRDSLIILDMNMPQMNGLETLANLRKIPVLASIPAVILSTTGNADMVRSEKKLGALNHYVKPSTMNGLLEVSRQIIFGVSQPPD